MVDIFADGPQEKISAGTGKKKVGHVKNCLASGNTSNSVTASNVPIAAATIRLSRCKAILRRAMPSAMPANANRVATVGCRKITLREWATVIILNHTC